jgi:acetyltransferase
LGSSASGTLTAEDPDHRRVEYALLVADPWQGLGLARRLTDHCLEIARQWGVEVVCGETEPDNARMIHVLQRHGLALGYQRDEGVVVAELHMPAARR